MTFYLKYVKVITVTITNITLGVLIMQNTKHSRQREKILEALKNTKTHPTASYVYEMVREEIPNISLGTVYRNLSKLSADGKILKLDLGTGSEHFDGDLSAHYHIICTKCKKITDVYEHECTLNEFAKKYFSGKITGHSLVFYGECSDCLEKI